MTEEEIEDLAWKAGFLEIIDDEYIARGDWLPNARVLVNLVQSAERERCAKYLRDAAARLAPDGKRVTKVDRYTASVPACNGDELGSVRLA